MKKSIVLLAAILITISLTAFGYMNWNTSDALEIDNKVVDEDFLYDVGSRFDPVTKAEISSAESIFDFLNDRQAPPGELFESMTINIVENEWPNGIQASGDSEMLNSGQRDLLLSAESSTHFSVRAEYHVVNKESGELEDSRLNPYLTIVPEKQATYKKGKESFLKYLRSNNRKNLATLESDKLRLAKLYFTVTKEGRISHIKIGNHSGYDTLDKIMINLLMNAPGIWSPAENAKGEKVDQELVISYGMKGC